MGFSHITHLDRKRFAGLSQRTSNALEMTEERRIPALWDQFWKQDMSALLSQAEKDKSIIALYSNYEQETNGFYTFSVGMFQEYDDILPDHMKTLICRLPLTPFSLPESVLLKRLCLKRGRKFGLGISGICARLQVNLRCMIKVPQYHSEHKLTFM